jgi:uncharacterized protein involved in exopolysaccharide biosynthesis
MASQAATDREPSAPAPSIFDVLTPLLRRWRMMIVIPLVCGVAAGAVSLVLPPEYAATTSFTTDLSPGSGPSGLSGLASLAGQFGITGLTTTSLSPDFFAEVLKSRELLRATLLSRFRGPRSPDSDSGRTLLELWNIGGNSQEARISEGIRLLSRHLSTRVDKRAGIVTLRIEGRPADLAADVANRMVSLLNQFNLERRQSQSRAQRQFVGERLAQAERDLRGAEAEHLQFLQTNRRYEDSPLLRFQEGRLARTVALRQEIFVTLSREYEQARIAEVRDTPVLTIIDAATPPDRRSFPRRKIMVLAALVVGVLIAVFIGFVDEVRRDADSAGRDDYRAFKAAWAEVRSEVRALWRSRDRA